MINIDKFFSGIFRECPGIPEFTIQESLIAALREFCRKTYAWQEYLDPMAAIANVHTYELEPSAGARVVDILSMRCGDRTISPKTLAQLEHEHFSWRDRKGDNTQYFIHEAPQTFRLVPCPETTVLGGIRDIRVALMPALEATSVGDVLYDEYKEVIIAGVLKDLLLMAKKPWRDVNRAAEHRDIFYDAVSHARVHARKNFSRAELYAESHQRFGGP